MFKWYFVTGLQNMHIFIFYQDTNGTTHDKDKHGLPLVDLG
jgi:hypothetical protein